MKNKSKPGIYYALHYYVKKRIRRPDSYRDTPYMESRKLSGRDKSC